MKVPIPSVASSKSGPLTNTTYLLLSSVAMTTFFNHQDRRGPSLRRTHTYHQVLLSPYYYAGEVDSGDVLTEKEPERWNDLELEEAAGGTPRRAG